MTTDLYALTAVCLWFVVLTFLPLGTKTKVAGLAWNLGNRDTPAEFPEWVKRTERAQKNLLENLVHFAPLVLVAHVAGRHNALTALAAVVFLAARVGHALVYIAGLTTVRTAVFFVGLAAEFVIVSQLR